MHSVVEEETLKPRQVRNQQSSFSTSRRTTRVVGLHALKHTLALETKIPPSTPTATSWWWFLRAPHERRRGGVVTCQTASPTAGVTARNRQANPKANLNPYLVFLNTIH